MNFESGQPPTQPNRLQRPWFAFAQRWLITTLAVLVAAFVVDGIEYTAVSGLVIASLILGLLNAFLGPLKLLLGCLTLGLFAMLINALLLLAVGGVVNSFSVSGFWPAFWGGLIISFTSAIAYLLTGAQAETASAHFEVRVHRGGGPPPSRRRVKDDRGDDDDDLDDPPGPKGPVIDV